MVDWLTAIVIGKTIFSFVFGQVKHTTYSAVATHLKMLGLSFFALIIVILLEFLSWKQRRHKNGGSEVHPSLVHQVLSGAFNEEHIYISSCLLLTALIFLIGLLQPFIYGVLVLISFAKCCIRLFVPLIDMVNLLFVYQQIMNSQYNTYVELISSETASVRVYPYIRPPIGLFLSFLICALRIALSLRVVKQQFRHGHTETYQLYKYGYLEFFLQVALVMLPYTSKHALSLFRRLIIQSILIKFSQMVHDTLVHIWIGTQVYEYGRAHLTKSILPHLLNQCAQWFFRGARVVHNLPRIPTVWNILIFRYALAVITLLLTCYYAEDSSSAVDQLKLDTFGKTLLFCVTSPDTVRLTVVIVLLIFYLMDTLWHGNEADTHGVYAFIWFLTGKDRLPTSSNRENTNNNEFLAQNSPREPFADGSSLGRHEEPTTSVGNSSEEYQDTEAPSDIDPPLIVSIPTDNVMVENAVRLFKRLRIRQLTEEFSVAYEEVDHSEMGEYTSALLECYKNADRDVQSDIVRLKFINRGQRFAKAIFTGEKNEFSVSIIATVRQKTATSDIHKILIAKMKKTIQLCTAKKTYARLFGLKTSELEELDKILSSLTDADNKKCFEAMIFYVLGDTIKSYLGSSVEMRFEVQSNPDTTIQTTNTASKIT